MNQAEVILREYNNAVDCLEAVKRHFKTYYNDLLELRSISNEVKALPEDVTKAWRMQRVKEASASLKEDVNGFKFAVEDVDLLVKQMRDKAESVDNLTGLSEAGSVVGVPNYLNILDESMEEIWAIWEDIEAFDFQLGER